MTNLSKSILCGLVISILVMSGCAAIPGSGSSSGSVTQQIMDQTNDPFKIARATYLDALLTYNSLSARFMKYQPVLDPEQNEAALDALRSMSEMLTMWEGFSQIGVTPIGAPDQFESYASIILTIISTMED